VHIDKLSSDTVISESVLPPDQLPCSVRGPLERNLNLAASTAWNPPPSDIAGRHGQAPLAPSVGRAAPSAHRPSRFVLQDQSSSAPVPVTRSRLCPSVPSESPEGFPMLFAVRLSTVPTHRGDPVILGESWRFRGSKVGLKMVASQGWKPVRGNGANAFASWRIPASDRDRR
jgi:hypothetical protein